MWRWLFCVAAAAVLSAAAGAGAGAARLVCYVENGPTDGFSECTHLVYAGEARGDKLDAVLKGYRKGNPRLKIILRVSEVDKDLRTLLKSKHVQGLELHDAHKSLNKTKVLETIEAARSAISSSGGGPLFLALPAHPELLAKYYDLRTLVKKVDLMMVQTHALGAVDKMTYHPSRLSGLWDMMNTDSVVDLVVGLGIPASKVVISLPATARQFTLLNETLSTPGSPTLDEQPREIDQAELCRLLQKGRWTLERDQDLSAPYAFKDKTWMSFEDSSSVDVKGKYARVRGLAGLALHGADRDADTPCGPTLRASLAKVLNQQSRAPRAAVLRSLEHEILSAPARARAVDALQVSPYRITQVVDSDGVIHSIREDTRTEFSCSRQGYFVHPRSCARFYRCVKFDQLSPEYTVFEFDCPAGLAFDSRYEVCVWPGSLPHSQACPGSSEIAPVPQTRFICPQHEGYYADPENCRWFFACLDHGKAPLTAYEFRCPFGLGFDADKLKCDWPWVVPACGNIARYEAEAFGYSGAALTGAAGFQGQTADAINIAAHQSLVSGASLDNLVGIQSGFLTAGDALDSNFIASQELANSAYSSGSNHQISHGAPNAGQGSLDTSGLAYQVGIPTSLHSNVGLVQPTKYTSGSIILDDYRLPTKEEAASAARHGIVQNAGLGQNYQNGGQYNGYSSSYPSAGTNQKTLQYQSGADYEGDNGGAYIHDPTGDYAEPYKHTGSPVVPYVHDDSGYKQSSDYYDFGRYSASQSGGEGKYQDNSGQYVHENSGSYLGTGSDYRGDFSGSYNADHSGLYTGHDSGKYVAGVYRTDGHIGSYNDDGSISSVNHQQYHGSYNSGNIGNYVADTKAYTGASHTLTAGAVNVGLVGKTTLVDADYSEQGNYNGFSGTTQSFDHGVVHNFQNGHVPVVSQPAVSINHVGTDGNNLDGYSFVTTPTSSGVPTTATPFAVTTSLPIATTYKTTLVPEAPKSSIKQIFGYTQPAVTFVQPTVVAVNQYATPKVQVTDYNQGVNYESNYNAVSQGVSSQSSGYVYSKPSIKFEDGISYTTQAPIVVSTFKPQGFSHSQQTLHKVESQGYEYSTPTPVIEPQFKKLVAYTTGPSISTYAPPTVSTYTPQAFSHETIHKVENTYLPSVESGYEYTKPAVKFEPKTYVQYTTPQPPVSVQPVVSTYQPQVYSQQTLHKVDASQVNTYSEGTSGYSYEKPASGYEYPKPTVKFEDSPKIQYTVSSTPAPVVSTYKPHSYTHQTLHKVETPKYLPPPTPVPNYEVTYQQPAVTVYQNPILKYTEKVTPVTYVQPTAHSFSQQTIHKVESSKAYTPSVQVGAYETVSYEAPKTVVQYTTPQPPHIAQPVVSTYQPQVYGHQTLHKVEASKVNAYSQGTESGYHYEQPAIKFEEAPKTVVQYSTPAPVISTYRPHSYSQQTIHKVEAQKFVPVSTTAVPNIEYQQPAVSIYENPILKYTQKITPAQPTAAVYTQNYQPIVHQHQVSHITQPVQYETSAQQNLELSQGYSYSQPEIQRDVETLASKSYSDASLVSHQVYHQSNKNQYEPGKNIVFVSSTPSTLAYEEHYTEYEAPKTQTYKAAEYIPPKTAYQQSYTVSTASAPVIHHSSVYHQTQEEYKAPEYIPPKIDYQQSYTVSTASTPVIHQSSVAHQTQEQYKAPEYIPPKTDYQQSYTVSTASTPLVYHSSVSHQAQEQYKAQEYIPPKTDYQQSYTVSTASTPVVHHSSVSHQSQEQYKAPEYIPPKTDYQQSYTVSTASTPVVHHSSVYHQAQEQYDYKPVEYSQQYDTVPVQQISFSTAHVEQPKRVESVHLSSFPGTKVNIKYNQVTYESPEIQTGYKAEEYLPPAVSTAAPVVTSTYKPPTYSTIATTREYLPPTPQPEYNAPEYLPPQPEYKAQDYLPPKVENTYLPPSTTPRTIVKSTTQAPTYKYVESTTYKAPEYLPPQEEVSGIVNFESFGLKNADESFNIQYNPYQEYTVSSTSAPAQRKQNIVVETAKNNLLGFGTVGPDAGLVSPVSYTTATPIISSTYAPEFVEVSSPVPVRRTRPKNVKYTTSAPYVESTTPYKAPEYLPPLEENGQNVNFESFGLRNFDNSAQIKYNPYQEDITVSTSAPIQRKQNIVVETAKSHLLGFGTVGPEAGLVSYTTSAPVVSSSEIYSLSPKTVTSTYAPTKQELVEVTRVPAQKSKPKVAVVTKINDFNPLLVRKLGAVCSCQSPVLVLKGRRPNVQVQQDYEDYSNDYEDGRGDIGDNQWALRSARIQSPVKTVTTAPVVSSSFNPIIVPDDSFYQDYQESSENLAITPKNKQIYSENYVSSTPAVVSSTEKIVRIRPRVKAVTVAPTYKTVLLNQEVAPTAALKDSQDSSIDAQSFDRYGPGGWRSRDETLQGSVDCQRAGLFRHPKQCNKFYACRWDCTKQRFTLHVFNCPVQLSFDPSIGACNWPSQGPACQGDTLLTNAL